MRKQPQKLIAKIPHYESDSTVWKQKIYNAVREAQKLVGIRYSDNVKLDVQVCFYLRGHRLTKLDLDNRLKQVGDALQGFINDKGGSKGVAKRTPIIPNDNQIYRLAAEKRLPSKRYPDSFSTITIRRYAGDPRTVADPRETRKHISARSNNRWTRAAGG